jgi:DNA-binding winged helix-turn-helix (wHTH) protein
MFDVYFSRLMGTCCMMGTINVLVVEPDIVRRQLFVTWLGREASVRIVAACSDCLAACRPGLLTEHVEVLVVNVDHFATVQLRTWAAIHILLLDTRVVALTDGVRDDVLESTLGAGVTALHPLSLEPAILCRAVQNAAQGIVDFDPALIERARRVVLQPLADEQIRFGGLTIDLRWREVTRWNRRIHLTPLEFNLLAYLAGRDGCPASLQELLERVWHTSADRGGTLAQVHNCIKRVRQKIEPDVKHPRYLVSERGWGYWLQDPTVPRRATPSGLSRTDVPLSHETSLAVELIDN